MFFINDKEDAMYKKPTLRERFRYWFDNRFSGGPLVVIGWLALGTALLVVLMTVFSILPGIRPEGLSLKQIFWDILFQALTPNPYEPATRWQFLLVMLMVTLGSLFIVSILIGTLTNIIQMKMENLRKGRSRVIESGHTLILGWSAQIFTILSELMIANENQQNARIVVLADKDKIEMEDEIIERIETIGSTRIICRSGNPIDMDDIEIGSPHTAKSIIILPLESHDPDASIIKTILAITNNPNRRLGPYHIVTQIRDPRNLEVTRMIGTRDQLQVILTGDLIARIVAQTSRQSGLSVIYTELMDFGGDEIYFSKEPTLFGKTYGEALLAYEDSAVMGIRKSDGTISMNPPMETRIDPGDEIFAISEDDDTVLIHGMPSIPINEQTIHPPEKKNNPEKECCLILGWNRCAAVIIRELDNYVPKGSQVTVMVDTGVSPEVSKAPEMIKDCCGQLNNQEVTFVKGDTTDRNLLEGVKPVDYNHIIVLSYAGLGVQEADAKTMVTLLHLRDISLRDQTPFSIVSEMLDLRNRKLAEVAHVDDFIVSDHLASLMLSQLSETADLMDIFIDIFNPEGSEIYLKPVTDYIEIGKPINFYTLIEAARRRGHTAIGYRLTKEAGEAEKSYGVHTNPSKSELIIFEQRDKLIVVSED
jgi:voltage-gated potassium channel Kch